MADGRAGPQLILRPGWCTTKRAENPSRHGHPLLRRTIGKPRIRRPKGGPVAPGGLSGGHHMRAQPVASSPPLEDTAERRLEHVGRLRRLQQRLVDGLARRVEEAVMRGSPASRSSTWTAIV